MTIGPTRQNPDLIEAEARRAPSPGGVIKNKQ